MFITEEKVVGAVKHLEELAKENQKELDANGKNSYADTHSRMVVHDKEYIYIFRKKDFFIDYLNYSPDLYSVLATPSLCSFKRNTCNRTQVELMDYRHEGKTYSPMLNRFAYFYYDSGMDAMQFLREFKEISELSKKDGIEIDHADNNINNNCHWNLSAIRLHENRNGGKGSLLAQIKPPYFCYIAVTPTGGYRVKFGYITPACEPARMIGQQYHIFCPNIEILNDFLKSVFTDFVPVGNLPAHLAHWGNPQYRRAILKGHKDYFSGSFETSASVAKELLGMREDEFVVWNKDVQWDVGIQPISVITMANFRP